jgi:hypothetical protein
MLYNRQVSDTHINGCNVNAGSGVACIYWTVWTVVDCIWNVMAHAQKLDFVFRRNGRVHLNRRGLQFSRLLAAEVCASAVVMLDTPCSEVVWRALATDSIRQFPLHFPSRASPCAITFQLDSTYVRMYIGGLCSLRSVSFLLVAVTAHSQHYRKVPTKSFRLNVLVSVMSCLALRWTIYRETGVVQNLTKFNARF